MSSGNDLVTDTFRQQSVLVKRKLQVEDGEVTQTWDVVAAKGEPADKVHFEATRDIDPVGGKLVRFEVWSATTDEATGLLFTNPVYFVDSAEDVPAYRLPVP